MTSYRVASIATVSSATAALSLLVYALDGEAADADQGGRTAKATAGGAANPGRRAEQARCAQDDEYVG